MSKHKSEDYKISAVKYYLNNDVSLDDVCEIFENAYNKDAYKDYIKKDSTLKRKLKNYKD